MANPDMTDNPWDGQDLSDNHLHGNPPQSGS
jgi:hypothetical protein